MTPLKNQTYLKTSFFCTFKVDVFLKRITLSSLPYGRVQRERKLSRVLGLFCPGRILPVGLFVPPWAPPCWAFSMGGPSSGSAVRPQLRPRLCHLLL